MTIDVGQCALRGAAHAQRGLSRSFPVLSLPILEGFDCFVCGARCLCGALSRTPLCPLPFLLPQYLNITKHCLFALFAHNISNSLSIYISLALYFSTEFPELMNRRAEERTRPRARHSRLRLRRASKPAAHYAGQPKLCNNKQQHQTQLGNRKQAAQPLSGLLRLRPKGRLRGRPFGRPKVEPGAR